MKFNLENLILPLAKFIQLICRVVNPYWIGDFLLIFLKFSKYKKEIAKNIERVFPGKYKISERKRLADKLLKNLIYSILEIICHPFFLPKIEIQNLENLKLPAIIVSLHTGNSESVQMGLRSLGYPTNMIVRDPLGSKIFKFLAKCRSARGTRLINIEAENMYAEAISALKRGEIVGLAADTGALEGKHIYLNLLGHQLPVALGWKVLAQRSDAAVIPVFTKRADKKNIVILNKPFNLPKNEEEVETVFQEIASLFESYLKEDPSNWLMFLSSYEVSRMLEGDLRR